MTVRIIDTGPADGFYNMAVDEALLLSCRNDGCATLRFYTFLPPAITIGRFQSIQDIGINFINGESRYLLGLDLKIDIVRRITGGRAILHDGDLTCSLVVNENHPIFGGSSFNGYKSMGLIFRDALRALGVNAELTRLKLSEYQRNPGCFSSISRYELQVKGKKIFGSAQRRQDGVILQQGSLLVNTKCKMQNAKWSQVGLNQILGCNLKIENIILTVKKVIQNMGINIVDGTLTSEEIELVNKLLPNY